MFSQHFTLRSRILTLGFVVTIICLLANLSVNIQLTLLTIIMLVTGIPHGSLDFYLEEQRYAKQKRRINRVVFFAKYLLYMLVYGILWFFLPNLSLIVFICITAYHFGEIDWILKNNKILNSILIFIYGLLMILFIITNHIDDTAPLIYVLLKKCFTIMQIVTIGANILLCCKIGFCIIMAFIFTVRKSINWSLRDFNDFLMQTLLIYVICTLMPFYLSFTFYFGIWHSTLSFDVIRRQLNFTNTMQGWEKMIKKSLPFVIIAVFALLIFSFFNYLSFFSSTVLTSLIVGIAVLTLPHLQVFSKAVRAASIINQRNF
ncbi:Brp/Blh family beta-carotene 15,15'-dioxygenase [Pedobacter sp. JCM 36344]|uniref:Brp/Blh family beta-carotene 15,15'-dioxygenase n=1 Tax=Pedobacter sp. JCM 36344 TaxID=3374280 RepID=UPI00397C5264